MTPRPKAATAPARPKASAAPTCAVCGDPASAQFATGSEDRPLCDPCWAYAVVFGKPDRTRRQAVIAWLAQEENR